jgi:aspartyl-tRNA(Asn)/glutamyl-tRNA(Gln) amidotransferase subunit C
MPVEIDIAKVAKLARLSLSPEELEKYGAQLQDILEHAERVSALPTEGVPPTSHPLPMTNAFRADEVQPSLDREEVLEQAPLREGEFFRVPRILGES